MNSFRTLPLLAFLGAIPLASAQNLIVNGDFETDHYANGSPVELSGVSSTLTGWTIINEVAGIGVGYNGNASQEIDLSGFGDTPGRGISQSFATTTGATYYLNLDVYGSAVDVLVDGVPLATNLAGATRTPYAFTFNAAGPSTLLTLLSGVGSVDHVDNVSVTAQAVPEPASVAAMGFGALALLRRRRKA